MLVCTLSEDGQTLELAVPKELPLETMAGYKPAGLVLRLDIDTRSIVFAHWNGQDLLHDNDLIACFVVLLIIGWGHPQSHILSEKSAREIAKKEVRILEPSSRYVLPLHQGLLYSSISPIDEADHFFSSQVVRQSMIDSAFFPIPHHLDRRKVQFRYFNFLYRARMILIQQVAKYQLDIK
jgi:hypothetical protein